MPDTKCMCCKKGGDCTCQGQDSCKNCDCCCGKCACGACSNSACSCGPSCNCGPDCKCTDGNCKC